MDNYNQQQGNPYQQQGNPYQQQGNPYQQQGDPYMNNGYGNNGGNTQPQKAPNIFQQFILAFVPTKYDRLTKVKTGSMIVFVTLLAFVSAVLSCIVHMINVSYIDVNALVSQMPDFTMTDGHLQLEEDFLYEEGGLYVYMTDEVDGFTYADAAEKAIAGYQDIILVGRNMIYIMQYRGETKTQYLGFEMFGRNKQLSKKRAVEALMPMLTGLTIMLYVFDFLAGALGYFLFAAVYLLFAMLFASLMKKKLEPAVLFRVAVYSKVPMFVAAMLLELVSLGGLTVPFLLRVAVTLGLMAFAIGKLPGNDQAQVPMTAPPMNPGGQGWQ